jgi:hypothetical protein
MGSSADPAAPTVKHARRDWNLLHLGTVLAFLLLEVKMIAATEAATVPVCGTIRF